ncbi:MAG: hypothetical protein JW929_14510 [Anaerolineales bacterium]|nr:hypothetical protein [Anaerolineales bacterium]
MVRYEYFPYVVGGVLFLFYCIRYVGLCFHGIRRRRPVFIVHRIPEDGLFRLGLLMLCTSVFGIRKIVIDNQVNVVSVLLILIITVLIPLLVFAIFYRRRSKSDSAIHATILGVKGGAFHLLRQALWKEGIDFSEGKNYFNLLGHNSTIEVSGWGAVGYSAIKFYPEEKSHLFEMLVSRMKACNDEHADKFSIFTLIPLLLFWTAWIAINLVVIYFSIEEVVPHV